MFYEMIGFVSEGHDPAQHSLQVFDPARAAIFLDFDGVLVDIAETPESVVVDEAVPGLLRDLHARAGGAVAIVSGRPAEAIRRFLPSFPGLVVGSHGAEIDRGEGVVRVIEPDPARIEAIQKMVEGFAVTDPAYLAEAKPMGAVLHFRRKPELSGSAYHMLEAAMCEFEGFHVHHVKMAFEVRPDGVGKEIAVEALMREAPFAGRRPVFFGDDTTDEPALAWVGAQGGVSVKVGEGHTAANCRLDAPRDVHAALRALLDGGAPEGAGPSLSAAPGGEAPGGR